MAKAISTGILRTVTTNPTVTNSAALVTIPELTFTAYDFQRFRVRGCIVFNLTGGGGYSFQLTFPAGLGFPIFVGYQVTGKNAAVPADTMNALTAGNLAWANAAAVGPSDFFAYFDGIVTADVGGGTTFDFAQGAATPGQSISIYNDSYIYFEDLGN